MDKFNQLEQLLRATDTKQEFNIVEDLKSLQIALATLKSRDFRKKLSALIEKYEQNELTLVREALLERCRAGDTQAIRLYAEYFKPATIIEIDDGLVEALSRAGKEAFKNEV